MSSRDAFESVRQIVALVGRPAFFERAVGQPALPYAVVVMDWELGFEFDALGGVQSPEQLAVSVECYGRSFQDAGWLDQRVYTLFVADVIPNYGVEVLRVTAGSTPMLTVTDEGLRLASRRFRIAFK